MLISILEITAVIAVIVGFIREGKLIAFEERLRDKIKTALAGSNSSDGKKNKTTANISK